MAEAVEDTHDICDARRRASEKIRWRLLGRASLLIAAASLATGASAQLPPAPLPLSNTGDARTLPKGTVLFRVLNAWTRFDDVFDAAADSAHHLHPLGDAFSAKQLGVRQFPALAAAEGALRTLTGDPNLTLSLGKAFATANTRMVTTPFMLEYGLTDRLTIGAMVPVVQTHSTVFVELNPQRLSPRRLGGGFGANVGPSAHPDLKAILDQLSAAATDLKTFIDNCTAANGCTDAQRQAATDVRTSVQDDIAAIGVLYGAASTFSPFGEGQAAVRKQLDNLASSVGSITGNTYTFNAPAGANAVAALFQLQQLATDPTLAAYDSLGSPDRIGIGDVEVSARFKLVDGFGDTTGGIKLRATLKSRGE